MPNSPNAKKALRQNIKLRQHNRTQRAALRTVLKKAREAAQSGDAAAAQDAFRTAVKRIDQAAAKKLIHKNSAARTKSRLAKFVKMNTSK